MNNQYAKISLPNFKLYCLCLLLIFTTIKLFSQNPTNQIVPIKGKVTFKNGIGSKNKEIGYTFKTSFTINDFNSFSPPVFTDANGQFSTSLNVPDSLLNSLTIGMKPIVLDSSNLLNGINTYDIFLAENHILGKQALSNIVSKKAADINKDSKITTGDLAILGQFMNQIIATIDFSDPYLIRYLSQNAKVDINKPDSSYTFQYFKAGDVNFSASTFQFLGDQSTKTRNKPEPMAINIIDQNLIAGKTAKVNIKFSKADEMAGFQFYLKAGPNLIFKNAKAKYLDIYDFRAELKGNNVLCAWGVNFIMEPSKQDFDITLEVTSKVNTKLSDVLTFSTQNLGISNNSYNNDGDEGIIYLNFIDDKISNPTQTDTLALSDSMHVISHQVFVRDSKASELNNTNSQTDLSINPNPAKEEIKLSFNAISNEDMNLEIYNSNGILSYQQQIGSVISGLNNIRINTDFLTNGLYLARLKSKSNLLATKKFVIQK